MTWSPARTLRVTLKIIVQLACNYWGWLAVRDGAAWSQELAGQATRTTFLSSFPS
jgi:hypothetical protein